MDRAVRGKPLTEEQMLTDFPKVNRQTREEQEDIIDKGYRRETLLCHQNGIQQG
jgi:hypothetical protein